MVIMVENRKKLMFIVSEICDMWVRVWLRLVRVCVIEIFRKVCLFLME